MKLDYFVSLANEICVRDHRLKQMLPSYVLDKSSALTATAIRNILKPYIPESIGIGHGIVLTENQHGIHSDILLYKKNTFIPYRDGDFLVLPPESILASVMVLPDMVGAKDRFKDWFNLSSELKAFLGFFSWNSNEYDLDPFLVELNGYKNYPESYYVSINPQTTLTVNKGETENDFFWQYHELEEEFGCTNPALAGMLQELYAYVQTHPYIAGASVVSQLQTEASQVGLAEELGEKIELEEEKVENILEKEEISAEANPDLKPLELESPEFVESLEDEPAEKEEEEQEAQEVINSFSIAKEEEFAGTSDPEVELINHAEKLDQGEVMAEAEIKQTEENLSEVEFPAEEEIFEADLPDVGKLSEDLLGGETDLELAEDLNGQVYKWSEEEGEVDIEEGFLDKEDELSDILDDPKDEEDEEEIDEEEELTSQKPTSPVLENEEPLLEEGLENLDTQKEEDTVPGQISAEIEELEEESLEQESLEQVETHEDLVEEEEEILEEIEDLDTEETIEEDQGSANVYETEKDAPDQSNEEVVSEPKTLSMEAPPIPKKKGFDTKYIPKKRRKGAHDRFSHNKDKGGDGNLTYKPYTGFSSIKAKFAANGKNSSQNSQNPNYKQKNEQGNHPIHLAVINNDLKGLKRILEEGDQTEVKNKKGYTPLHFTAELNLITLALELLEGGADVNSRNYVYDAPIHLAVLFDNHEMVRVLVEHGAELEVRNNRANTPMHRAARFGSLNSAKILIKYFADIHAKMERDLQPLHLAAWYGHTEIVQLLIDEGADLNAINSDGNTALHFAAFNGQVKIIKTLINNKANTGIENLEGETYLQGINEGYQGEMTTILS